MPETRPHKGRLGNHRLIPRTKQADTRVKAANPGSNTYRLCPPSVFRDGCARAPDEFGCFVRAYSSLYLCRVPSCTSRSSLIYRRDDCARSGIMRLPHMNRVGSEPLIHLLTITAEVNITRCRLSSHRTNAAPCPNVMYGISGKGHKR